MCVLSTYPHSLAQVGLVCTQHGPLELLLQRRVVTDNLLNCMKLFESLAFTRARWDAFTARYRALGRGSFQFEEMSRALQSTPLIDASFGSRFASYAHLDLSAMTKYYERVLCAGSGASACACHVRARVYVFLSQHGE